jgi:cell division transport system permease protein
VKGYGLFYYIGEAFRGLRDNSVVNLLAVGTISMAMLILGFFLIVFVNLQGTVNAMSDRLEVSVYLRDGLTEPERAFLLTSLRAEPGVKKVTYLSKAQALEIFKKELKGQEALLEGLGENPLPDSYEVGIDRQYGDADRLEAMAKKFSRLPGVEDVSYGKQGAEAIAGLFTLTLYGGIAVSVLLGVTVVFIVSNSVRLALYSRGQEIELMQWIGATKGFIQGPFLVEGMLIGMLGTSLAVGVLAGLYYALPQEAVAFLSGPIGLDFLPPSVVAYMVSGGGLLGLTGGLVSASRFLE